MLRRFNFVSKKKTQTQQKCWSSTVKKSSGPKFIFLEGGAATGKSTIINYLDRMGYRVKIETFVALCEKVNLLKISQQKNPRYLPQGTILPMKWMCSIFHALEDYQHEYEVFP
jgi:hypothetical protein